MKYHGLYYVVLVDGEKWLTRSGLPVSLRCLAAEVLRSEADKMAEEARARYGRKAVSVVPAEPSVRRRR